jgi:hypothetical protein
MDSKRRSVRVTCAVSLLAIWIGTGVAAADPTVVLAGPGELSGSETVIQVDDQGLSPGDAIPMIAGVDFQMTDGSPAIYGDDPFLREFGPAGIGAIGNFFASSYPYPDLSLLFEAPVNTLAFGMRANPVDDVQVTFFLDGEMVDQLTLATLGSDQLYFYGFHKPDGFDEVVIDVLGNRFIRTGAFTFDNLTFNGSGGAAPAEFSCVGFESPVDRAIERSRNREHLTQLSRMLPRKTFSARLVDADGIEMTGADLVSSPMVRVSHAMRRGGEETDVTRQIVVGGADHFTAQPDGSWSVELNKHRMRGPGGYRVSMETGDDLEYTIEPTCESWVVRKR